MLGCFFEATFPSACPRTGSLTVNLNIKASNIPGMPTTKKANRHPNTSLIHPPANNPNIIPKGMPKE